MQSVVQTFVEEISERTEKESSDLLKETMRSRRENDMWEVW